MPASSSAASTSGSVHGDVISGNGSGSAKTLQWLIVAAVIVVVALLVTGRKKK